MKDGKEGMEELTVSSAEQVARRLSSKGEKSISVTRSVEGSVKKHEFHFCAAWCRDSSGGGGGRGGTTYLSGRRSG